MSPIALLLSDIHLSLLQPSCRNDKDWLAVQAHYLEWVRSFGLTVICAGDIFDRWNPPPELINFALKHLPDRMVCVPGQHDLPLHRVDLMHRSGYGVLVESKKIVDISGGQYVQWPGLVARGFGWDEEIEPLTERQGKRPHIAVIHRYCWTEGKSYPGAPENANVNCYKKNLKGYDAAVFGDNHKGFCGRLDKVSVMNCGGFIRRKSDEIDYEPQVGLLMEDGTIKRQRIDTSIDSFYPIDEQRPEVAFDMQKFVDGLEGLGEAGLDFKQAVKQHLKKEDLDSETKEIILTALEQNG